MNAWERYLALDRERREVWDREQTIWLQDQVDLKHAALGYTGATHDLASSDWAAWLNGVRIGWQSTKEAAAALVRDQVGRELKQEGAAH